MSMTKVDAEQGFKEFYGEVLAGKDIPAKRMAWQVYVDGLCRGGEITQKQCDTWGNPSFVNK